MKKLNLISFFVALIFLVSCEKDSEQVLSPNDNVNLELRSGGNGNCTNFIQNGDFEDNQISGGVTNDCLDNLHLVANWSTVAGEPYVATPECNQCTPSQQNWTDHLDLNSGVSGPDVVRQPINYNYDPDIQYYICFDAAYGGSESHIVFQAGIYNIHQLITNEYSQGCQNSLQSYTSLCFEPTLATDLRITLDGTGTIHVDNIQMFCKSEYLTGINVVDNGNCNFTFSPQLFG